MSGTTGPNPYPGQQPYGGAPPPPPTGAPQKSAMTYIKLTVFAVVLAYVILFVFFNTRTVPVSFVFVTVDIALIFVLLGTLVIGAVLGAAFAAWWRRRSAGARAAKAAGGPRP